MEKKYRNFIFLTMIIIALFSAGCGGALDDFMGSGSISSRTSDYNDLINLYANKNKLPPNLVKAVIEVESAGDKDAVSSQGAMGLMQLMPETAKMYGVKDAFAPEQNIAAGTKYLKSLAVEFDNDYELALAAYNAGPNSVKKYNTIPPYKETINYVDKVMRLYKSL